MNDDMELRRIIWRLEQPNTTLYGSLRVDVAKAASFLRELLAQREAVHQFSARAISAGRLGEMLGLGPGELHDFKNACGSFDERPSLEAEAKDYKLHKIADAAIELEAYLWSNVPDLISISTNSELAGEGVRKRIQALREAISGRSS